MSNTKRYRHNKKHPRARPYVRERLRLDPALFLPHCLLSGKSKVAYRTRADAERMAVECGVPLRVYPCLLHWHLTSQVRN